MLFSQYKMQRLSTLISEPWGAQRIPDLIELQKFARPRRLLEIGCYRGVSTEFWLLHCEYVLAVDPWPDWSVHREFLSRCKHYPHLNTLRGLSPDVLRGRHLIANGHEGFDMVYIDGDHSYEAVKRDIMVALPMLQDYGYIAGHDYHGSLQDEVAGVAKAVHEMWCDHIDFIGSDGSFAIRIDRPQKHYKDLLAKGYRP